jgi:ApeA N-terminal domain 1
LGDPGLVYGTLSKITLEEDCSDSQLEAVSMIFPGELNFPPLESTERYEKVNDADQLVYAKYDHSQLSVGSEEFTFWHYKKYTELYCRLNSGSIQRNAHRRMQESLGFALSSPLWPQAITQYSEGKKSITLFSPSQRHGFKGDMPPFHFAMQEPQIRRHFFEIVSAYYQKILSHHDDREHPVSRGLFLVMEALRSYADVQVLTLGVAAEYLIKRTFPKIAAVEETFAKEVADLRNDLDKTLGERLKSRLFGFLGIMLEPSPYEMIRKFCEIYGLDKEVAEAWRESRNPTAHGDFPEPEDFLETLNNRHKVLYLCYAIVLAFIGYEGPHSRYDLPGWPVGHWPARRGQ